MKITKTALDGVVIIEPQVFEEAGLNYDFIQDNQSKSCYGTIRGIHFQKGEFSQAKLVRVLQGTVLDVAVDLRKDSKTFGQHVAVELSAENNCQLMIPRGFGHGFSVLTPTAVFAYKCDNVYNKASEAGIRFDDPALGIDWKVKPEEAVLSDKDKILPFLKDVTCF